MELGKSTFFIIHVFLNVFVYFCLCVYLCFLFVFIFLKSFSRCTFIHFKKLFWFCFCFVASMNNCFFCLQFFFFLIKDNGLKVFKVKRVTFSHQIFSKSLYFLMMLLRNCIFKKGLNGELGSPYFEKIESQ